MNSDYDYLRILNYEAEIKKLKDDFQYLENEYDDLHKENSRILEKIVRIRLDNDKQTQDLEAEIKKLEHRIEDLEQENATLLGVVEELEDTIGYWERHNGDAG